MSHHGRALDQVPQSQKIQRPEVPGSHEEVLNLQEKTDAVLQQHGIRSPVETRE